MIADQIFFYFFCCSMSKEGQMINKFGYQFPEINVKYVEMKEVNDLNDSVFCF